MANTSPSSRQVDDFLSSLSQLSQSRIKQDQQRQRSLQRNIDDLQSRSNSTSPVKSSSQFGLYQPRSSLEYSHNAPSLKFNRATDTFLSDLKALDEEMYARRDQSREDSDIGPPFPSRPKYGGLDDSRNINVQPRRDISGKKIPPPKPAKQRLSSGAFDIELLQPTSRKSKTIYSEDHAGDVKYVHSDHREYSSQTGVSDVYDRNESITYVRGNSGDIRSSYKSSEEHRSNNSDETFWTESSEMQEVNRSGYRPSKPSKKFEIVRDNSGPQYKSFAQIEREIIDDGDRQDSSSSGAGQFEPAFGRNSAHRSDYSRANLDSKSDFAKADLSSKSDRSRSDLHSKSHEKTETQKKEKPMIAPKWIPPNSSKAPKKNTGPMPLFPQNVYYNSSSSIKKSPKKEQVEEEEQENATPGKPIKPGKANWLSSLSANSVTTSKNQSQDTSTFQKRPKSDWLSSTLANKVTTSNHQGTGKSPPAVPRQKADWLSSTMANSRTTVSAQDSIPPTPPLRFVSSHQGDWISSLSNSKNSISPQMSTSPNRGDGLSSSPSYMLDKKPTSWIDSALKKSDSHKYIEPPDRPTFKITKKEAIPEVAESTPELFTKFQTLKSRVDPRDIGPPSSPTKQVEPIPDPEYLSRFSQISKNGYQGMNSLHKPSKPSIDNYTKEESELLKSTMSRLSASKVASVEKPSVDNYTREESELLKSTMSRLSASRSGQAPPKPPKPPIEKYTKQEEELLSNSLARLSPKKRSEKPTASKYESDDTELLRSQMKKLGSKSVSYKQLEKKDDVAEALTKQLRPVKPTKPKIQESKEEPEQKTALPASKNFQDQLSSIMRASTAPELGGKKAAPAPAISRTRSERTAKDTEHTQLTHPNKGRSKGPKRRLPGGIKNSSGANSKVVLETSLKKTSEVSSVAASPSTPSKAKPPVNKSSKPANFEVKPSRSFSGELFI